MKVRFQNPTLAGKYHSTLHAIGTIVREEKFVGLFKGITSPLVRCFLPCSSKWHSQIDHQATVALMNGVVFASYRFFMKLQLDNADSVPTMTQIMLAGAGSGIVCSYVSDPQRYL